MIKIGARIAELRKQNHISQTELAQYLDVTPQAVSKWENEVNVPDLYLLPMIAQFFDVSIDTLFGVEDRDTVKLLVSKYASRPTAKNYRDARETLDRLLGEGASPELLLESGELEWIKARNHLKAAGKEYEKLLQKGEGTHTKLLQKEEGTHTKLLQKEEGKYTKLLQIEEGTHTKPPQKEESTHTKLLQNEEGTHTKPFQNEEGKHTKLLQMEKGKHTNLLWSASVGKLRVQTALGEDETDRYRERFDEEPSAWNLRLLVLSLGEWNRKEEALELALRHVERYDAEDQCRISADIIDLAAFLGRIDLVETYGSYICHHSDDPHQHLNVTWLLWLASRKKGEPEKTKAYRERLLENLKSTQMDEYKREKLESYILEDCQASFTCI